MRIILRVLFFVTAILLPDELQAQSARHFHLTGDQMGVFSNLYAGYAGGLICDVLVDTEVAKNFIEKNFGNEVTFSSQQVAELGSFETGIIALQMSMMGGNRAAYCRTIAQSFGPRGSSISGLLHNEK
jgi:hypothetical protein